MTALIFFGFGIYLVTQGLTADNLIDESEGVASKEERADAKATPLTRLIVVAAGAICAAYGVWRLLR